MYANRLRKPKDKPIDVKVPGLLPKLTYLSDLEPGEIPASDQTIPKLWRKNSLRRDVKNTKGLKITKSPDNKWTKVINPSEEEINSLLTRMETSLEELGKVEHLKPSTKEMLFEGLANLGLLQITLDIGHEMESGRPVDLAYWKKKIIAALVECEEHEPHKIKEGQLYHCLLTQRPSNLEDVKEEEAHLEEVIIIDNPLTPPPPTPTKWYPDVDVPPYVPTSPPYIPTSPDGLRKDTPYVPKSPMVDELEEVWNRVSMLEDCVDTTTHEWKEKVWELEAQIFANGCEVINLKWEQAELKEQCRKDN